MMNYEEAREEAKAHEYLEGSVFKGKTISTLLIAPLKEVGIPKLVYNLANEISSDQFYKNYNDFEIWVIFDLENWEQTGILDKMLLTKLLAQFNENS